MDVFVTILKWISQLLIVVSGVSAMFHELTRADTATGRKRLTASGRLHMSAVVLGLLLFGATELCDMRKSAEERDRAKERDRQQRDQIARLQEVLSTQKEIEAFEKQQIEDGKALAGAQRQVIETQSRQNERLRDVLLSTYQLSGLEISIYPIEYAFKQFTTALKKSRPNTFGPGRRFRNQRNTSNRV